MYKKCIKRLLDFTISLLALIVLAPVIVLLTLIGTVAMKGNPFFTQLRPGKINSKSGKEHIFRLIKFRTMSNSRDKNGNLLPDEIRLNKYGRFLRSTSLDELPELFNILIGDMSIIGPRPLLVKYLPLYSQEQRRRHNVRPGLTGLAQTNGRNALTWEMRFAYDIAYVDNITFSGDIKIILSTVKSVLIREGINSETSATMEEFKGTTQSAEREAIMR
ncbi:MAG: sugar transferase [Bacteroidales bacterium]|nr:sugar transferase [Bacteroidales bacterium]